MIGFGTVAGRLSRLCGVLWLRWLSSDNHLFSIIGSKGGAVLSPVWPGHKSWRWSQMWVEFVVGSLSPCSVRVSLQVQCTPVFSTPQKTNILKLMETQPGDLNFLEIIFTFIYSFSSQRIVKVSVRSALCKELSRKCGSRDWRPSTISNHMWSV